MPKKSIREVLKRHADELMAIPGVVGVAEGECQGMPCIKVFVVNRNPELLRRIPDTLEGYLLQVKESGDLRALDPS